MEEREIKGGRRGRLKKGGEGEERREERGRRQISEKETSYKKKDPSMERL
jgi:hypothetical protein